MYVQDLLQRVVGDGGSDIFLLAGSPVTEKVDGKMRHITGEKLSPSDTQILIEQIYRIADRSMSGFEERGDDDFSFAIPKLARFRVNAYRQRGSRAAVIRVVAFQIPDYKEKNIPEEVMKLAEVKSGMILVTGTAGSGKSTTQACILDRINNTRQAHIVTLEDPIEFLHSHKKSIISQREVAIDTENYIAALRACLRQAPDVILLGEMRDYETIRTAMTAAETGHLVIATLHTKGTVNTIDRIIDSFPSSQQAQIRVQLSVVLHSVVSQQLVPDVEGKLVPAYEIMHMDNAIKNMIRDNKNHQIANAIAAGSEAGMVTMDQSLIKLYKDGKISKETLLYHADNTEHINRRLGL